MNINGDFRIFEIELELDRWFSMDRVGGELRVAEFVNNGEMRRLSGDEVASFVVRFGADVAEFVAEMRRSDWEDGVIASQLD